MKTLYIVLEGCFMTVAEMKKRKQEKGYTYAQIAELSGVPLGTVQKIFSGETVSPRYETLQALAKRITSLQKLLIHFLIKR